MPNGKPGPLRHQNTQRIHFFRSSNKTMRHSPSRDVAFFNVGTPYYPMRTIPKLRKYRNSRKVSHVIPNDSYQGVVFNPLRKLMKFRPRTRKLR